MKAIDGQVLEETNEGEVKKDFKKPKFQASNDSYMEHPWLSNFWIDCRENHKRI